MGVELRGEEYFLVHARLYDSSCRMTFDVTGLEKFGNASKTRGHRPIGESLEKDFKYG